MPLFKNRFRKHSQQTVSGQRRTFLKKTVAYTAGIGGIAGLGGLAAHLFGPERAEASKALRELAAKAPKARFWTGAGSAAPGCSACHEPGEVDFSKQHKHPEALVKCQLCAQECLIGENERGKCRTRFNLDGELRTLSYGHPISTHVDPIEKKPFYHFLPQSEAFSLATAGCPLKCKFCQNYQLSQANPEDYPVRFVAPEEIAEASAIRNVPVIAYTYNEPTVFTEYLLDIAREGKKRGLQNVLISCGFMQEAPLAEMCEALDAIKIDLKGYSDDFYTRVCGARLAPVLRSIKQVAKSGTHLEIVNLVVPTLNDSEKMLAELSDWILGELGPDVPIHFTRFHPDYQLLNLSPTPVKTLERARDIAMDKGIHYAFVGNVPGHPGNHTYCPGCGDVVIKRIGFIVRENKVVNGNCESCGHPIAGVWV